MQIVRCPVFDIAHELGWMCSVAHLEEFFRLVGIQRLKKDMNFWLQKTQFWSDFPGEKKNKIKNGNPLTIERELSADSWLET